MQVTEKASMKQKETSGQAAPVLPIDCALNLPRGDSKLPLPSTNELLKEWYKQTKSRHEDDRAYLKLVEAAIINAANEQNGGGEGEGAAN